MHDENASVVSVVLEYIAVSCSAVTCHWKAYRLERVLNLNNGLEGETHVSLCWCTRHEAEKWKESGLFQLTESCKRNQSVQMLFVLNFLPL